VISFTDPVVVGPVQSDFVFVITSDDSGVASQGYILTTNTVCDGAVYASGTETLFTSGTRIITQTDESNNGNYICARATDSAGNTTYTRSIHPFNIDVTPPAVNFIDLPAGDNIFGEGEPGATINVTTPSGAFCNTSVNAMGNWACTLIGDGVDGESATVVATDAVGNVNTVTETNALDRAAPTPPIVDEPTQNPVTGTGIAGDVIDIITDSGAICTATVQPDNTWECILAPEPIPGEGYIATATDPFGNTSAPALGNIYKESERSSGGSRRVSQEKLDEIFGTPDSVDESTPVVEDICVSEIFLTENMRQGDVDGKYSAWEKDTITEVKKLQGYMNERNYRSGPIDGIFGPLTDAATKRMQKELGTREDGRVGPITRSLLNSECSTTNLAPSVFELIMNFLKN
jgi:hypothetical protein